MDLFQAGSAVVVEYEVIQGLSDGNLFGEGLGTKFEQKVQDYLNDGWKLAGGGVGDRGQSHFCV
jgi:hypothetical protein